LFKSKKKNKLAKRPVVWVWQLVTKRRIRRIMKDKKLKDPKRKNLSFKRSNRKMPYKSNQDLI